MEAWRVEVTVGGKKLSRGIDPKKHVPGRFTITITIFNSHDATNHILSKCTAGYKLSKSEEKINYLMYMNDIKPFCQKRKSIGNPNTNSENIE